MDDRPIATICETGKQRFTRVHPAHYTFKIKSFSLLEAEVGKYETSDFEAGGYKWRLVFHPRGIEKEDDNSHISLFLAMAQPDDTSLGWEVFATVSFFVFDQLRDRYLVIQDANRKEWRFHMLKTEWGFAEFLSHDTLNNPCNGYLVNDCCTFGVEIFVTKSAHLGEAVSSVKEPRGGLYTWKIDNFSVLNEKCYDKEFYVEGIKWKLKLYPKGDLRTSGKYLGLSLLWDDLKALTTRRKLFVKGVLRIRDQTNRNHSEATVEDWFDVAGGGYIFTKFMSLDDLEDPSKGYLVKDCMIIEAVFDFISVVEGFS